MLIPSQNMVIRIIYAERNKFPTLFINNPLHFDSQKKKIMLKSVRPNYLLTFEM